MGQFSDVFACSKMPRLGNGNSTSVHPLDLDGFRPVCLSYYTVCSHYRVLSFLGGSTVGADGPEYCNYRRLAERDTVMETSSSCQ